MFSDNKGFEQSLPCAAWRAELKEGRGLGLPLLQMNRGQSPAQARTARGAWRCAPRLRCFRCGSTHPAPEWVAPLALAPTRGTGPRSGWVAAEGSRQPLERTATSLPRAPSGHRGPTPNWRPSPASTRSGSSHSLPTAEQIKWGDANPQTEVTRVTAAVFPRPLRGPDATTWQSGPTRDTPLQRVAGQRSAAVGTLRGGQRGLVPTRREQRVPYRKSRAAHWGGEPNCLGTRPEAHAAILGRARLLQRPERGLCSLQSAPGPCCDACGGVSGRRTPSEEGGARARAQAPAACRVSLLHGAGGR